jgi:lipopolysaccharide biosynthesis glycosyltransferase
LAGDDQYAQPLAVAAKAVLMFQPDVEIYVLDMGFTAENRQKVEASLDTSHARTVWVETLQDRVSDLPNTWASITRAGYARLFIPEIVQSERAIYLDCDVMARRSVDDLYNAEMDGNVALATYDVQSPFVPFGVPDWYESGRAAGDPNFNSGVMLMDLDAWRGENATTKLLEYLSGRHLRAQDQEAINAVLGARIGLMDPRWNQQAEIFWKGYEHAYERFLPFRPDELSLVRADPWLVHFSNQPKPWQVGCEHPRLEEWRSVRDTTAFAGQRPVAPPQHVLRKIGRPVVRFARRLAS